MYSFCIKNIFKIFILLSGLALGASAIGAPPPHWKESGVFAYNANRVSVQKVLQDFAKNFNATVIGASSLQGVINGRLHGATPEDFLNRLGVSYQFTWFFYSNILYIAPIHDRATERIFLGDMSAEDVRLALEGIGLFEEKFGWGELKEDKTVIVSGPRVYLDLVKSAVTAEEGSGPTTGDETMIFRLRYAFLEDRIINFRDTSLTVPGLLSVLRNLLRDNSGSSPLIDSIGKRRDAGGDKAVAESNVSTPPPPKKLNYSSPLTQSGVFSSDKKGNKDSVVIEGDVRTNSIIIRGDTSKREYYRRLISQLDQPQQMVEIEALIIDIQKSKLKELGIDWAATFGGGSGRTTVSNSGLSGLPVRDASTLTINNLSRFLSQIRALEGEGTASIIGKPAVMTMENIGAVIDFSRTVYLRLVGERVAEAVPVTVGTLLKVTPKVVTDGGAAQIQLFIDIEDGSLLNDQFNNGSPVVERSLVATQMIVDDQQSLVIGGYNVQSSKASDSGVPGLSRVPVVRGFFRSESAVDASRERIFVITPRLINNRKAQTKAKFFTDRAGVSKVDAMRGDGRQMYDTGVDVSPVQNKRQPKKEIFDEVMKFDTLDAGR